MEQSLEQLTPARNVRATGFPAGLFWLAAAILTVAIYWLCLRFFFPGYFAPLSPTHIDFYTYAGVVRQSFPNLILRYPRPVSYVGFKLLGMGGLTGVMVGSIAIALVNMLVTLALLRRMFQLDSPWLLAAYGLYALVLFSHPQFYLEHRHDLPAQISWLFLAISLVAWLRAATGPAIRSAPLFIALFITGICAILFAFSKETYFVSAFLIVAGLAIADRDHWRRHAAFAGFLLAVEFASLAWTNHFKGPFVNLAAAPNATYHISLAPADLAKTWLFYLVHMVNPGLAAIAALGIAVAWPNRRRFVLAIAWVAAGLAAFTTLAMLPNHKFAEYSWAGAPLFLAPAFLIGGKIRGLWIPAALAIMASIIAIAGPAGYRKVYDTDAARWWIRQDRKAALLEASLAQFKAIHPPARILIAGLDDSGIPWQEGNFVEEYFGDRLFWTIIFPPAVQYRFASATVAFRDPRDVRLSDYDYVALYHASGQLISIRRTGTIAPNTDIPEVCIPDLAALESRGDYASFLRSAELCVNWGFIPEARRFLDKARTVSASTASDAAFQQVESSLPGEFQKLATPELFHRPELTARVVESGQNGLGVIDLFWSVPEGIQIEIHVNSPAGVLFTAGRGSGHARTDKWVTNGMTFFLQDVTGGKPLTFENTIAAVRAAVN